MIRFYNTLTRTLESFETLEPNVVRMYHCGPTVYDHPHIGNFRAFLFGDLLRRYFEYRGFRVMQVMNITDVGHLTQEDIEAGEDRLVGAARRERMTIWEVARKYTDEFLELLGLLNVRTPHQLPRATEHVAEMIEHVKALLDKGHAYLSNRSVYFSVESFPRYGRLSGNTLEELKAGHRVEVHADKKHPFDFALWKYDPEHPMKWASPWGEGFPGWHIECSTMAMKYLGEQLDLHTGGEDNIFPHHECEIAQAEAETGKQFVRAWLHTRHLLVNNEKMSKSKGNFFTVPDLLERGFDPMAVRYALIATHYRQPLNFTLEGLKGAASAVERLCDFRHRLGQAPASSSGADPQVASLAQSMEERFREAMEDDLNVSAALAAVFDLIHEAYKRTLGEPEAAEIGSLLDRFDSVLGLGLARSQKLSEEEEQLIDEREKARQDRDFARADELRDQLRDRGLLLEDTPQGVRWKRRLAP